VLDVSEGSVTPRTRETAPRVDAKVGEAKVGCLIVDLKGVGVKYENRTVSLLRSYFSLFDFFLFFFSAS